MVFIRYSYVVLHTAYTLRKISEGLRKYLFSCGCGSKLVKLIIPKQMGLLNISARLIL